VEKADQPGRGGRIRLLEQLGRGGPVGAGERAHPFDQVEEFGALLADEGLAEQVAEAPDVRAQRGVVRAGAGLGGWIRG
jgi:hypothetical protein